MFRRLAPWLSFALTACGTGGSPTATADAGTDAVPAAQGTGASGGARFQLQSTDAIAANACPDAKRLFTLARRGGGDLELLVDGVEGARVTCRVAADGAYTARLDDRGTSIAIAGSIRTKTAVVTVETDTNRYESPAESPCTVELNGDRPSMLDGGLTCPELRSATIDALCAFATGAYFRFQNCSSG
jgi:hypothetical protein